MTRVNALLLLALLLSSLYLVQVSHESRKLFSNLDKARSEQRALSVDFERLQTEKQSQATPLRIEKVARDKLAMRMATPAVTQYVDAPRAAPGAASEATR